MGSFNKPFLFLLFLMAAVSDSTYSTNSTINSTNLGAQKTLFVRTHVRIFNNLGDNQGVSIHCKSKDNDLGTNVIYNDQCYGWHFHSNIWGITLFFCHFSWSGGEGTYDIYKAKRDCRRCDWY